MLVAIAIPVFTRQLERSREATDFSNVRSAYAELVTAYLTDGGNQLATVPAKQTVAKWQSAGEADNTSIGTDITVSGGSGAGSISVPAKTAGSTYSISINGADGTVTVN